MQGSFEKKVQEKLDELRLTPTAPVWEKIEHRIRPEKKRRRGVFWLFVLLGVAIAAGWWLRFSKPSGTTNTVVQQKAIDEKKIETIKKEATTQKEPSQKFNTQSSQPTAINNEKTNASDKVIFYASQKRKAVTVSSSHKNINAYNLEATKQKSLKEGMVENNNPNERGLDDLKKQQEASNKAKPIAAESLVQNKKTEPKDTTPPTALDNTKKKVAATQTKWLNKLLFSAGWSSLVSPNAPGNFYSSPTSVTGTGSGQVGNSVPYQASAVTKGFSFSIGYAKEKKLNDRLIFSVGLQYAYYSTHQKVGVYKLRDTAVRFLNDAVSIPGYFSSSSANSFSQTDYTTRYHVIELPVGLQWRLLKSAPLWFSTGVSYGRLLKSNALTFDAASGLYYENNQNNKKNFLAASIGLQYALVNKKGWSVSAGPTLQYNLSSLQKVGAKQHLLFTGLKTTINF